MAFTALFGAALIYVAATKEDRAEYTPAAPVATVVKPPGPEHLAVGVVFDGIQVGITNLDDFDWTECEFQINPHGFTGGYSFGTAIIKAHSSGVVDANRFTESDGLRFDPSTHAVNLLTVACKTPYGQLTKVTYPATAQN